MFKSITLRAEVLSQIRAFFASRQVLEVETPLLSQYTVTAPYIESFATPYCSGNFSQTYFLQTSPEYAMKRLLAKGSGPIFQICKAFRNQGEFGGMHNPEFTLLEWYRPGFDHHALMDEMDDLLQLVLNSSKAIRKSYRELFLEYLQIDPLNSSFNNLQEAVIKHNIPLNFPLTHLDRDACLQLLLSECIEPKIGFEAPFFLYDFPASQAALSKIRTDDPPVAERFEVYIQGVEIANGFHELNDANEQLQRFKANQLERQKNQQFIPEIDQRFLASLNQVPDCAGVALGIDRLLMIKAQTRQIADVINIKWDEA